MERQELVKLIALEEKAEDVERLRQELPERRAAKEAELAEIKTRQENNEHSFSAMVWWMPKLLCIAIMLFFIPGTLWLAANYGHKVDQFLTRNGLAVFVALAGLLVLVVVTAAFEAGVKKGKYALLTTQLGEKTKSIEAELVALANSAVRSDDEIRQQQSLHKKFGVGKSADYRQMQLEGDALLKYVVGDYVKSLLGADYYNSLGDPPAENLRPKEKAT